MLLGLGLAGGSFMIVLAAFARLVPEERRSWAMGLATAAGSLGQFLFAPLGQAFIDSYGAVQALVMLSFFVALVPLLAIALTGRGDDADGPEPEVSTRDAIRGAFEHPSYVLLTAGFFVCGFHIAFVTTHLPPYLGDLGFSASLARVVGRAGRPLQRDRRLHRRRARRADEQAAAAERHLLARDRVPAVRGAAAVDVQRAAVRRRARPAVALDGAADVGAGGDDVRHPPRRMLFGFVFLSHQVGAFVGVWLGGAIYEATGAYEAMWWLSIALGLAAAIVHLPIHERRAPRWAPAPA